ncbi:MAG: noncanonical pyrimidine nucleotidase, YjjG family [Herbinix sp.]|jgi:2-haloacid dehalogenase|nr:noncanonical pyrimidine nucleotidase, YjjG family [Herbinix sp.]
MRRTIKEEEESTMIEFKTILLDADDTLFDFGACEREALRLAFERYEYEYSEEIRKIYEKINVNLWKQYELGKMDRKTVIYSRFGLLFQELGIVDDGIAFEDDYQELLGMQHFFIEGAMELILYLHKKYKLYIVTNGVTATQLQRLKDSRLDQYMKKIFVSEETGYQKPMKEFFDYCFERMDQFDRSTTLIIGDSLSSDMKGGNNAGITTCWYNPKHIRNMSEVKVDIEIHDLKELYQLL